MSSAYPSLGIPLVDSQPDKFSFSLSLHNPPQKRPFHQIIKFYRGGQASPAFQAFEKEKGP